MNVLEDFRLMLSLLSYLDGIKCLPYIKSELIFVFILFPLDNILSEWDLETGIQQSAGLLSPFHSIQVFWVVLSKAKTRPIINRICEKDEKEMYDLVQKINSSWRIERVRKFSLDTCALACSFRFNNSLNNFSNHK